MSLLKDMVKEMATGAGSIAGATGSLFGGGVIDSKKMRKRQRKMFRRIGFIMKENLANNNNETKFNASDVLSKLDAGEKQAASDNDTVAFGLEDEKGRLVKVYVRADQAENFERALANKLAEIGSDSPSENKLTTDRAINSAMDNTNGDGAIGEPDTEYRTSEGVEIAEVLYDLQSNFDIINVVWPEITGDEEEEQELEGERAGADGDGTGDDDDEMVADETTDGGDETDLDGVDGDGSSDEADATSALSQVIDMMKAEAEAKKAEACARKAEADAKIAGHTADAANAKVQQEEEILDMEAHYDNKKKQDSESKRLAKLAKWKHDLAKEECGNEEEEEDSNSITPAELSKLISRHLRHQ